MGRSRRINVPAAGRILDHLAMDRKRTVVVFGLVAVLAIMWIRVLLGRTPGTAAAAPKPASPTASEPAGPRSVRFVELPKLPGRHDAIYRDFFAAQERPYFRPAAGARDPSADAEVHVVSSDHAQEVIRRVAQRLKLEAVLRNENPRAFINDRLLGLGDKITVKEGTNSFEFEVLRIYENSVLLGCTGTQLTLKLAQYLDVSK
jgi:hypothetical protein